MKKLDKFYSDILRAKNSNKSNLSVIDIFLLAIKAYDKNLENLAVDLVSYWSSKSENKIAEAEIDFFYALYCFLTCEFSKDQDFSFDDWKALYESVIAADDELDIQLLQSYFSVFLERGIL